MKFAPVARATSTVRHALSTKNPIRSAENCITTMGNGILVKVHVAHMCDMEQSEDLSDARADFNCRFQRNTNCVSALQNGACPTAEQQQQQTMARTIVLVNSDRFS